jgi:protein SCO1/2
LVLALVAVGGAALWTRIAAAPPPPVLGEVPEFRLVNRDGRAVTRADLAGSPWVADFIFTRCAASCPLMTARLARLGRDMGRAAPRRVSFTVDPAHDTPEVLARYAASYEAAPDWLFLTGPAPQLHRLMVEGFKLALDPAPPPGTATPEEPILHSTRIVLVDGQGRIRGYYDAFDEESMARLRRDAALLARRR